VVPRVRRVVTVSSGIGRDIQPTPPQIDVKQVRLRRTVHERSATHKRKTIRRANRIVASAVGTQVLAALSSQRSFQRIRAEQPHQSLVPRTALELSLAPRAVANCLNHGTKVVDGAVVQREYQRAVILTASRHSAA